jgi:outer membrane protein OmpA-like peptidoglycan-associated protein
MACFALAFVSLQAGAAEMPKQDIKDSKDHPMLSRYVGSKITGYKVVTFDEDSLPAGREKDDANPSFEKVLRLEGKITKISYNFPGQRSTLEVMRNFKSALQAAGFNTLFACDKEACGERFADAMFGERKKIDGSELQIGGDAWHPFNHDRDPRYVLASAARPDGGTVHLLVYVVGAPSAGDLGAAYVEVVESAAMDTNKVSANLSADQMSKSLATEGKVAVYGIYFDTDKTDIKPESKPALDEMAKLLKGDPRLAVYIVGHTDNQGAIVHNTDLSQRRADAVVKALLGNYQVPQRQLMSRGVASLAPVASNDDEAGRAKNRRVELVKQ